MVWLSSEKLEDMDYTRRGNQNCSLEYFSYTHYTLYVPMEPPVYCFPRFMCAFFTLTNYYINIEDNNNNRNDHCGKLIRSVITWKTCAFHADKP